MLFFNTLYIIITLIFARPSQNYTVTGAPVFPFMSSMILLNSKIKNNDPGEVVDGIKLASWRWGLSRHKIPVCLFYEWCWDPGLCLRQ
jgi:hypothetical protein